MFFNKVNLEKKIIFLQDSTELPLTPIIWHSSQWYKRIRHKPCSPFLPSQQRNAMLQVVFRRGEFFPRVNRLHTFKQTTWCTHTAANSINVFLPLFGSSTSIYFRFLNYVVLYMNHMSNPARIEFPYFESFYPLPVTKGKLLWQQLLLNMTFSNICFEMKRVK